MLIPQKEVKDRLPLPGQECDVIRMFSCVPFTRQLHKDSLEGGPLRNMLAALFSWMTLGGEQTWGSQVGDLSSIPGPEPVWVASLRTA